MSDSNHATTALLSFLTGAAAGAVTGVLFAPDKGSRTREKIKHQASQTYHDVGEGFDSKVTELKSEISTLVDEMKQRVSDLESELKKAKVEAAKNVEQKAKEAQK
ncbi:MAG: YtxH domain-containing protein [Bacteroidales bacterium]|jgi:gas vesicle protein